VSSPWALLRSDGADGVAGASGGGWWRFSRPAAVLRAARPEEVPGLLGEVEAAARGGLWAVGLVAYEAAGAFDPAQVTRSPAPSVPAAWFALFEEPEAAAPPIVSPGAPRGSSGGPATLAASVSDEEYLRGVDAIREAIARGDTYQANWTYRLWGSLGAGAEGTPLDSLELFARLCARQDAPYAAFLDLGGGGAVCSVSPELFFRRRGRRLLCRPMKGTAPRGRSAEEDRRLAGALRRSAKERAENLMIVDMVRNDLGRIARPGSVRVSRLFELERYATVHQMTSTVEAESDASLTEVFGALFPCASVTGAPRVRTMEILAGLESTPRGVYTGAIGYVAPGGAARFSVAIRTAWVGATGPGDRSGARLEYGTGGGIVWDSDPARELAETRIKARVLIEALAEPLIERPGRTAPATPAAVSRVPGAEARPRPVFELLETLLWRPGTGFVLLERHLARLAASADHFGFPVSLERVRGRLVELGAELEATARHLRVRLLVGPAGEVSLEALPLEPTHRPWTVALAAEPIDRKDPFLRHKTTRREVYERPLERARARAPREDPEAPPPDDVLLWNREGELTESTVANLVVRLDGRLLTPPATSGLLPGTLRAELLARGRIEERIVRVEDLGRAEAVYLINSLRGWLPARLAVRPGLEGAARLAGNEAPEVGVARGGARSAPVPLP